MLLFTNAQEAAILAAREGFNRTQVALAANHHDIVGNAAPIPLDAWRRIDSRAVEVQRDVLAVFNRFARASTTPVGMGDLVNYFPKVSDSGEVHVSMDGRSEGKADQALIKYEGTPVPIFDSFARFGWRQMEVMRKGPGGIDTQTISNHQRKVAESLESVMLNGRTDIVVAGSTIYGLLNSPIRNTNTHGLTLNGATGAQWLATFSNLINTLISDNSFGKVTVFLNYGDYTYASLNEFTAGYPKTILARLREIEQVADIIPASRIPANNVVGVNNIDSGDWGTILSAMPLTTRPKARHNPEDDYVFGVIASAVPQLRSDYDGRSPLAHLTAS